jgi:hypothetical protein
MPAIYLSEWGAAVGQEPTKGQASWYGVICYGRMYRGSQIFGTLYIKDHRKSKKHGLQYLVSQLNYSPVEDSWEPAANLRGAQEAIDEY